MNDISTFVTKHRKQVKLPLFNEKTIHLPWYKRPIERDAFIFKMAKNGKYYIKHQEWSEKIWIGPYDTVQDVNEIIDSYVNKSMSTPLDKTTKTNNIHSVYVENINDFFKIS